MARSDDRETLRPEIDQTVTLGHIKRIAALYALLFVVALALGSVLWVQGAQGLALVVWLFGNGFTAFIGIVTVCWDLFEYLDDRRDEPRAAPERELAPDLRLSQDVRIGVKVLLVLLAVTALGALVAELVA